MRREEKRRKVKDKRWEETVNWVEEQWAHEKEKRREQSDRRWEEKRREVIRRERVKISNAKK